MNNQIKILLLLLSISLICCNKSNPDEVNVIVKEKFPVEINVYYVDRTSNKKKPDAGSKIYLYYDMNIASDLYNYVYDGNGIFRLKDILVKPDTIFETDVFGKALFEIKYEERPFSIYIVSAHQPDAQTNSYYLNNNEKNICTCIFY